MDREQRGADQAGVEPAREPAQERQPAGLPAALLQRKIARRLARRADGEGSAAGQRVQRQQAPQQAGAPAPARVPVEGGGADLGQLKGQYSGDGAVTAWSDSRPAGTSTPLPYTPDGGWDAQQILTKLGQVDEIAGTDSDGVRCVQAVALSSHILGGPADTASYLGTAVMRMIYEGARMQNGQPTLATPTPRKVAAGQVLATVSTNILNRVATYGDLSWAQEALHDIFIAKDNEGTPANKVMDAVTNGGAGMVGSYSSNQANGSEGRRVDSLAAFAPEVDALKDGEQLIATQIIQWTGVANPSGHQLIVYRQGGKTWLYDPQREDDKTVAVGRGAAGLESLFERNADKRKWILVAGKKNAAA